MTAIKDHIEKLFNRYLVAMNRWEIAFNANNGNTGKVERERSRTAHAAYQDWQEAEREAEDLG